MSGSITSSTSDVVLLAVRHPRRASRVCGDVRNDALRAQRARIAAAIRSSSSTSSTRMCPGFSPQSERQMRRILNPARKRLRGHGIACVAMRRGVTRKVTCGGLREPAGIRRAVGIEHAAGRAPRGAEARCRGSRGADRRWPAPGAPVSSPWLSPRSSPSRSSAGSARARSARPPRSRPTPPRRRRPRSRSRSSAVRSRPRSSSGARCATARPRRSSSPRRGSSRARAATSSPARRSRAPSSPPGRSP